MTMAVNIGGWLLHFLVVAYAWPFLRSVWRDDSWWDVVSFGDSRFWWMIAACVPIVSWPFLIGFRISHGWRVEAEQRQREWKIAQEKRRQDVQYWLRAAQSDSPILRQCARDVLEFWGIETELDSHG